MLACLAFFQGGMSAQQPVHACGSKPGGQDHDDQVQIDRKTHNDSHQRKGHVDMRRADDPGHGKGQQHSRGQHTDPG